MKISLTSISISLSYRNHVSVGLTFIFCLIISMIYIILYRIIMKEADLMKNETLTLDNSQSDPDVSDTRLPDKV